MADIDMRSRDDILAELVDLRAEYADLLCDLSDPLPTADDIDLPVWPGTPGALERWQAMPQRQRPLSGPFYRAACWEMTARERWHGGDYAGAVEAIARAVELVTSNANAIRQAAA